MLRRITGWLLGGLMLMLMPLVPVPRMCAIAGGPMIEIGFVIVRAPNPPGSRALMMPFAAVLLIAPANVLHGAVREQGFASSPTPDTHVRVACAPASGGSASATTADVTSNICFLTGKP